MKTMIIYDTETTTLEPLEGELVAIGVMLNNGNCKIFSQDNSTKEQEMLEQFWDFVRANIVHEFVGFNNRSFDSRWLLVRSFAKGVKVEKKFFYKQLDLRLLLNLDDKYAKGSLVDFAKLLDTANDKLGGSDGGKVAYLFKEGRYGEINSYLIQDLKLTRTIYDRLDFCGLIL